MLSPPAVKPFSYGAVVVAIFDFWIFVLSIQASINIAYDDSGYGALLFFLVGITIWPGFWFVTNFKSDMATVWTICPAGFATVLQLVSGIVLTYNEPIYDCAVGIVVLAAAKLVAFVILSATVDRPIPESETPLIGNNWPVGWSTPTFYRTMPNSYAASASTSPFSS